MPNKSHVIIIIINTQGQIVQIYFIGKDYKHKVMLQAANSIYNTGTTEQNTYTGETRQIKHHITCESTYLTYMIQCKRCKKTIYG